MILFEAYLGDHLVQQRHVLRYSTFCMLMSISRVLLAVSDKMDAIESARSLLST